MILYYSYILYHSCRSQKTFIRLSHFDLKTRFVFFHYVTYLKLSRYKTEDDILHRNMSGYEPNFVIRLIKFESHMINPLTPFLNLIISLGVSRCYNHIFCVRFCITYWDSIP